MASESSTQKAAPEPAPKSTLKPVMEPFSFFSPGLQKMAYSKAKGDFFTLDEALLNQYLDEWRDSFAKRAGGLNPCGMTCPDVDSCVFRGFMHWLRYQELPSDQDIRRGNFPDSWAEGDEQNPLACSMAVGLYIFGWLTQSDQLYHDSITFLFEQYQQQRIPPSKNRVHQTFTQEYQTELKDLFVDLHIKFCDQVWDISPRCVEDEMDEWPKEFLFLVFMRNSIRNYRGQRAGVDRIFWPIMGENEGNAANLDPARPGGMVVLRLSTYHLHNYDGCARVSACRCKDSEEGLRFVIV